MEHSQLFQIGQVAKMFCLSVSTLRHYEAAGLLIPEYIDPDTGYRYYSVRQFEPLNIIRYLRALDMPLPEIADFIRNRDINKMEEMLRQQKEAVAAKQQELQRIERKIENQLQRLKDVRTSLFDVIQLLETPPCRIISMQDSLKIHGFLDMEEPIRRLEKSQRETAGFFGKVGVSISASHLLEGRFDQYDSVFLILDEEDRFEGETMQLPRTLCASIRFHGSHPEAPPQYEKLMDYIRKNHLKVTGFSREITIVDYGLTNDMEQFVTEIRIPVVENSAQSR